jgi:large subunit ribosomal protein L7/L12
MSAKVDSIIKELKELSLLEASELVKAIEETFDVSAAAPVAAVAAPAAGVAAGDSGEAVEEKTEFTVKVTEVPADKKIAVIKVVKNALNIGLAEAKTKVEGTPFVVLENAKKEDADKLKTELSGAGATVALE